MRRILGQWVVVCGIVALALAPAASATAGASLGGDGAPSVTRPVAAPTTTPTTAPTTALRAPAPTTTAAPTTPTPTRSAAAGPSRWEQATQRRAPHAAVIGSIVAAVPAVPAAPAMTVTPSTGLTNEAVVNVSGTGFSAGELVIAECTAAPTGPESCDLRTAAFFSPNPDGSVEIPFTVIRTLLASARVERCESAPGRCTLIITNIAAPGIDASAPLTFATGGTRPNPSIVANPNTGLIGGDFVTVTGTGFRPSSNVEVSQCVVGVPFCNASTVDQIVGTAGGFSVELPVSLHTRASDGSATTCLVVQCAVVALSFTDIEDVAVAQIAFDSNQPPPAEPKLTVTPATGLHHNQTVTVSGTGFDANSDIELSECGPVDQGFCPDFLDFPTAGLDGSFSTEVSVSRLVTQFELPDPTVVDCGLGGCTIQANEFSESGLDLVASATIAFDATVPPPPLPVVTAAPLDNLPYRASIAVTGTGFSPGEQVFAERCVETELEGFCAGSFDPSTADAQGNITLTVPVKRISHGPSGDVDCVDPGVTCFIAVSGQRSYEQFQFTTTFDPNAPIPPPPAITVTPNTNLGYREAVRVQGSNFTPGASINLTECAFSSFPDAPAVCSGGSQATTDAGGGLDTNFSAHRVLFGGFSPTIDCTQSTYRCLIVVSEADSFDFGSLFGDASAPVSFDPNSVPPPPPVVKVRPSKHLHDGQTVDVSGSGFGPDASIGLALCKAGPLSYADCDLSGSVIVPADSRGAFATPIAVGAHIETFAGTVDCTTAPGACVLGVTNFNDPATEYSLTPLSFDVPPPDVIIGDTTVSEDGGFAKVEVLLSAPSNQPVRVEYVTHHGSARAGSDYIRKRWGLRFAPGVTRHVIRIQLVDDHVHESTESFRVVFDDPEHAHIVDDTAIVTITDND